MRQLVESFVRKYDAATVFVIVATVVVVVELSLMRLFVPASPVSLNIEEDAMMAQVCEESSVTDLSMKLEEWKENSMSLTDRLVSDRSIWQKDLIVLDAFGKRQAVQIAVDSGPDIRSQQILEADFAVKQLSLQSVMTGRKSLANINGKIYTVGDTISLMGGEIIMTVKKVGSDYAVLQLADAIEADETTRTIYLSRKTVTAGEEYSP